MRLLAEAREQPFDEGRLPEIVVRCKHEEGRPCFVQDEGEVSRRPNVLWLPEQPDSRILGCVRIANFGCAVGGAVVRNNELEIGMGLCEKRIERFVQMAPSVEHRHADGDRRRFRPRRWCWRSHLIPARYLFTNPCTSP